MRIILALAFVGALVLFAALTTFFGVILTIAVGYELQWPQVIWPKGWTWPYVAALFIAVKVIEIIGNYLRKHW